MIHVCSLARLQQTIRHSGATHVVTVLKDIALVERPAGVRPEHHLHIDVDDITSPMDGYRHACDEHVERLMHFVSEWDRGAPMVIHCFAGISRSTASAYAAACALNPERDEADIARALRRASPTAMPNSLIVSLADRLLGRQGRMIRAIEAIGPGELAYEADPFRLDLK
ncbi:MAG TPA: protein tyrosine phosphatase [Xanthobacteraceae bacterium]|nr:protein tyrosine phosphatase [Xanthobacteraceae bacterium]